MDKIDHKSRAHALLSASSAHRWLACPPSAVAAEAYDDTGSDYAAEGTLAHEVAEWVASGKSKKGPALNKGQDDGVHTEMGVIASGGVVGIVVYAGSHYSMILPTINVKSNISCRIRHSNYFGSLQWDGGSSLYAYLNDVPRYAKIKVGDYVETSGYSTVFPSGIFVGRVVSVDNAPDGLSLQMKVNLSTDFGALSDVCVVVNDERAELESLQLHLMKSGENAQ